jgi:adhesin HecA-like repeat protein
VRDFWNDQQALTTVEYALLMALVIVAGVIAWQALGLTVITAVDNSAGTISDAGDG